MTTGADLINLTSAGLHNFTEDTEALGTLTSALSGTAGATTFTTDNLGFGIGVYEIDDELVFVNSFNSTTGTASVPAWGRGFQNTTVAAHASGAMMVQTPRWPRSRILSTLNDVIGSLDGELYAIRTTEFTPTLPVSTYSLPADCTGVLQVTQQTIGPTLEWRPLNRWRQDLQADPTTFATGTAITFNCALEPNRPIRVAYTGSLSTILETDNFVTVSGLSQNCQEILVLGAQYRLILATDLGRLQSSSVQQDDQSQRAPVTSATKIATNLKQLFDLRVADEKRRLMKLTDQITTFSR